MSDSSDARSESADPTGFGSRKRFGCFTDEDAALLEELQGVVSEHSRSIVDEFYLHLTKQENLKSLLNDPATVARLKDSQQQYLESLTSGRYDADYAEGRLRIGRVHDRIGLEPHWYLGSYGLYLTLVLPLVAKRFAGETDKAVNASSALAKLILLDIQLILDAYYGLRQKKAVEHSEQLAAVGELAASIAHEVRNPLAGMKGALEVLRSELAANPSNVEIVSEILLQIGRLENLVRDLLSYAKPRLPAREAVDLHELVDRAIRLNKDAADRSGVTMKRSYGPGSGNVVADPQQFEQAFMNLVQNALQAMESGGTLSVVVRAEAGGTVIVFRDTGPGIDPVHLSKVLQPFFTTRHRGSGLGLPIVRKIVEGHGGTIQLTSDVGRGTTATLTIPRKQEP